MFTDRIGIITATHLECSMPEDPIYIPVMAGSALKDSVPEGYVRDDTGDNISEKNAVYCELTALYWGWKQLDKDIVGLCHYRRLFASGDNKKQLLGAEEIRHLLQHYDVILPKARDYKIETNYTHYAHSHSREGLEAVRSIIDDRHPEYIEAFDRRMAMTEGHRFNMFIMRRCLMDEYCSWLFDILSGLEKKPIEIPFDEKAPRIYGYVAERLLDVWIDENSLCTTDLNYIYIGKENLILKGAAMCCRKLRASVKETGIR